MGSMRGNGLNTTIAIIGAGMMGAGIGGRLHENGCRVLTLLEGRSEASHERAATAGMENVALGDLAQAELILSIVPPAQADAVVETLAPLFAGGSAPLFCDANALSPDSKREMAQRVEQLGGQMVDGAIIGAAPRAGHDGPRLYACGKDAHRLAKLSDFGVETRILEGPLGAAASLKMCYGGINKGIIGLTTAMLLAAQRHGAAEDVCRELAIGLKPLLDRSRSNIPAMYPRAYRWDAEMHEIAAFLAHDDPAAASIWHGIGEFFTDRAQAHEAGRELGELVELLG